MATDTQNNILVLGAITLVSSISVYYLLTAKKKNTHMLKKDRVVGIRLSKRVALEDFPNTENIDLLLAAKGKPTKTTPVWAMRQAGRYLPEFRELRKDCDFFTMCQNPQLACEVTLQPLIRFPMLDAVIVFSDILVIPQAMGMEVLMVPGRGPVFPSPLKCPQDMKLLDLVLTPKELEDRLGYVFDVVNLTRQKVSGKVPVIGFSGAPFTLMGYMIEGGGSKTYEFTKKWLYNHVEASHKLLDSLSDIIIDYCVKKAEAGAQLIQIFESSAGEITPALFFQYCFKYLQKIGRELRKRLGNDFPLTVFARSANYATVYERLETETDFDVIGVDWKMPASVARRRVKTKALQGNLDPCALFASREDIDSQVKKMIEDFKVQENPAYIANLGHGMMPRHDPEHLRQFITSVKKYSRRE